MTAKTITMACVGAGYWGKNLVRVFHDLPQADLKLVCDPDEKVRTNIQAHFKDLRVVEHYEQVLADDSIEAVVLAVPAVRHYECAKMDSSVASVFVNSRRTYNKITSRGLISR